MKVKINTDTDYLGKDSPSVESFYIEVEGQIGDTEGAVADTYLKVREILRAGIKPKEDN